MRRCCMCVAVPTFRSRVRQNSGLVVAEFVRTLTSHLRGDHRILANPATTGFREPDRASASSGLFYKISSRFRKSSRLNASNDLCPNLLASLNLLERPLVPVAPNCLCSCSRNVPKESSTPEARLCGKLCESLRQEAYPVALCDCQTHLSERRFGSISRR